MQKKTDICLNYLKIPLLNLVEFAMIKSIT